MIMTYDQIRDLADWHAKDTADRIDSDIFLELLRGVGAKLDDSPIPLVGRYFYNPETNEIEAIDLE